MKPQVSAITDKGNVQMTLTFSAFEDLGLALGPVRLAEVDALDLQKMRPVKT